MPADSHVDQLLEHILESECKPEEACREHPELLADVRLRLTSFRRLQAEVDLIFPPSGPIPPYIAREAGAEAKLPEIPGYIVEAVVGRGGMGVVYRARHLKLNRAVALKMLLAGSYASPIELARFKREAEAVAALTHPNIVQVYDVGEVDGHPYYTMEFVAGQS